MIEAITTGSGLDVTAARQRAAISRDDFLQILVTELTNQDPLEPMDNAQFLQQLVGLQTLEQTSALTDALKTFERVMQVGSASGMIGREVKAINSKGEPIEGVVTKVVIQNGNVQLEIDSELVSMTGVLEII